MGCKLIISDFTASTPSCVLIMVSFLNLNLIGRQKLVEEYLEFFYITCLSLLSSINRNCKGNIENINTS